MTRYGRRHHIWQRAPCHFNDGKVARERCRAALGLNVRLSLRESLAQIWARLGAVMNDSNFGADMTRFGAVTNDSNFIDAGGSHVSRDAHVSALSILLSSSSRSLVVAWL